MKVKRKLSQALQNFKFLLFQHLETLNVQFTGLIWSMIYFGHSVYDIQGNKYYETNSETLEVQDFTNTFWNFIRGNFPEQILCFLNFKLLARLEIHLLRTFIWGYEVYRFENNGLASLLEAQLNIVVIQKQIWWSIETLQ